MLQEPLRFDGSDYNARLDRERLTGQLKVIYKLMQDEKWRSLSEIAGATDYGEASISAQLRNLRKTRFGAHTIEKKRVHDLGLFVYRLIKKETP